MGFFWNRDGQCADQILDLGFTDILAGGRGIWPDRYDCLAWPRTKTSAGTRAGSAEGWKAGASLPLVPPRAPVPVAAEGREEGTVPHPQKARPHAGRALKLLHLQTPRLRACQLKLLLLLTFLILKSKDHPPTAPEPTLYQAPPEQGGPNHVEGGGMGPVDGCNTTMIHPPLRPQTPCQ